MKFPFSADWLNSFPRKRKGKSGVLACLGSTQAAYVVVGWQINHKTKPISVQAYSATPRPECVPTSGLPRIHSAVVMKTRWPPSSTWMGSRLSHTHD